MKQGHGGSQKVRQGGATSWKELQRRRARGSRTRTSRKRRLQWIFRSLFFLSLSGLILAGVLIIAYTGKVASSSSLVTEEVEGPGPLTVELETDGVLTEGWLRETFPDLIHQSARRFDVHAARDLVEGHGQVVDARVSVRLPGHLRVKLREREPVLRVRVKNAAGKGELWLLSRDGHFYRGAGYPPDTLRRLPGLTGLKLQASGEGYRPVPFFGEVARLLDLAREGVPSMYRHWRLVDLRDWHPMSPHRSSLIRVRSGHVREIVFSPEDAAEQIERLRLILEHTQREQMGLPRFIDLSFEKEGVVRYEAR